MAMLSLILMMQGCNNEEIEPDSHQQKLNIGFSALSAAKETLTNLPPESKLVMSIQAQNGEAVMEYAEMEFQFRDNHFVTRQLDLPAGNYTITDFMVLNASDEIIFAAPKAPGTLSNSVPTPLNYNFTLRDSDMSVDIDLRLLDVRNHTAADFGYSSFKIPKVLSLEVTVEGQSKPTTATAILKNGDLIIRQYNLQAKMNLIFLPGDVTGNYTLTIVKFGYASVQFTLSDILRSYHHTPLKVSLAPAFSILALTNGAGSFQFGLAGPEGDSVTIDWGDGAVETLALSPLIETDHPYATSPNLITVTGDIGKITSFYSFYGNGPIEQINFEHLTDLKEIRFGLTSSPKILDLRNNAKLEFALLLNLENLEALYLPPSHNITSLGLSGPNHLSPAAVDAVINNMYKNIVSNNIMNGSIGLQADWQAAEGDETFIGPPSAQGLAKLKIMQQNYNWEIFPNPFD